MPWPPRRLRHLAVGWALATAGAAVGAVAVAFSAVTSLAAAQTQPAPPTGLRTPTAAQALPPALVLDQVTVIDVEHGARWRQQRVVLVGNRIRALGEARTVRLPPGARVVDARGKYLIPGLWDMHSHPVVEATPAGYRIASASYRQLVANGVTGIRDAGAAAPLDTFRVWKQEIAAGTRVGPRLVVSGPSLNTLDFPKPGCTKATRSQCSGPPHYLYVFDTADARHLVDSLRTAGADMLQIHNVLYPIWMALAAEARRVGLPFAGHMPDGGGLDGLSASDSGVMLLDHQLYANTCGEMGDTLLSLVRCTAAAARLRRNHTWITSFGGLIRHPTWPDTFVQRALRYTLPIDTPAEDAAEWRPPTAAERRRLPTGADWAAVWAAALGDSAQTTRGCQAARLAYAANLPWLPGPDVASGGPVGLSIHLHLLYPVLCGVPPLWVLQAATLEPARALRLTDSLGTVAVGKVADLVLLDGDPLEDIWNVSKIAAVVTDGHYFDRAALDRVLVEAAAAWRQACTRDAHARSCGP